MTKEEEIKEQLEFTKESMGFIPEIMLLIGKEAPEWFNLYRASDKAIWKDTEMENKKLDEKLFLERMSRTNSLLDHSIEECGKCFYGHSMAQIAREMIEKGDIEEGAIDRWENELEKRWQESKFYKLWNEESKAGRDPHEEFERRGWIP